MKKLPYKLTLMVVLAVALAFCDREDPPNGDEDVPIAFVSLEAGRDTIFTEDTTLIRATASGYRLTYNWFVEKGDLLGSGATITFLATPCTVGTNIVYCTVRDGYGKEKTREVSITVF
jgi:hypothetical protein